MSAASHEADYVISLVCLCLRLCVYV